MLLDSYTCNNILYEPDFHTFAKNVNSNSMRSNFFIYPQFWATTVSVGKTFNIVEDLGDRLLLNNEWQLQF